jgi:hypothetical protein
MERVEVVCNGCLSKDLGVELSETGLSNLFVESTNRVFEHVDESCDMCGEDDGFRRVK